jgi:hypothetical protein
MLGVVWNTSGACMETTSVGGTSVSRGAHTVMQDVAKQMESVFPGDVSANVGDSPIIGETGAR